MSVRNYFEKVSNNYDNKRTKGLFGTFVNLILVNKERDLLIKKLNPQKNEFILDAGCGNGYYSNLMKKFGANPLGIDISHGMIKKYKSKKLNGVVGDILSFNFKNKFDKVFCAGLLEFTNFPIETIKIFNKILKNDGTIVILFPRFNPFGMLYFIYHKLNNINIKLFSNNSISLMCHLSGFEVVDITRANLLTKILVAKKHRKH